jgi:hypothetical protein
LYPLSMQAPPPYIAPQPKNKTGLIIAIVLGVLFVCCGLPTMLAGGGLWFGWNKMKGTMGCAISFAVVRQALDEYVADHNGKLPPAAKWQDEIRPYYAKALTSGKKGSSNGNEAEQVMKLMEVMPADGDWGCTNEKNQTGMAFNSVLSGKKLAEIKDRSTVLIFEVPDRGKNLNRPYKELDKASSPMVFNSHRGWLKMTIANRSGNFGSGPSFDFDSTSDSK